VFTVEFRDRVREHVLTRAEADPRIVAAAAVGSLAAEGDRWSDLDLTFGVEGPVEEVIEDWTREMVAEFDAAVLFDLPLGDAIYRVFLLPGCLQVDLSFAPPHEFGARGPKFALLFGEAAEVPQTPQPDAREVFGFAAHHAVRAHFCIERGKLWQAEFWISGVLNDAFELACVSRGIEAVYGRGRDRLPPEVLEGFEGALVRSIEPKEVRRALDGAIAVLLRESGPAGDLAENVAPMLRELTA
jgi:hypothetical protein